MNEPTATAGAQPASNRPTVALVLGIIGILCCPILAPVAWFIGSQEIKAIRAGQSPSAGEGLAKAGMILGIIGTVFIALWVLWVFFAGGMAILQEFG